MEEKLIVKSIDHIKWNQTIAYILDSAPVVINAPIYTVWKYVLDISIRPLATQQ